MAVAIVTGGSRGLGLALSRSLVADGWRVVVDGRDEPALDAALAELRQAAAEGEGAGVGGVVGVAGDVTDPAHRRAVLEAARRLESVELVVNNASTLGPSPRPTLAWYPPAALARVYEVNVLAPLALTQDALPDLRAHRGTVVNVTSDAGDEAYEGWGGYGSSKAALEHLSRVLANEEPAVRVYAVDPGDLRTRMHQEAFPDEDISDRPPPEVAVPGLRRLVEGDLPSGRYRAQELAPPATARPAGERDAEREVAGRSGAVAP